MSAAAVGAERAALARELADRGEFSRRTAAEVARLTADGCAGHHDKLAAVWREARRAQAAAARVRDLDAARTAAAELAAVAVLSPHSLKIGVASRASWRARSRRVRLLARLGLAFLLKLTRELEPLAMARDVCGARALHVRADVPDDERERLLAWAVASVAIEAVRGRVWGVGPTLEHDAAELLAAKLVARCARRSKVRAIPGSSTPGTTTAKGGGPRPRRSPVVRRAAAHPRPVRARGLAGVARGLVALALALVVALVVGHGAAYAAQENAPIGWRAVGADREGKLEMAKGKGTTAPRYSGNELHAKVLEAAEAEVVRRHAEAWEGFPSPLTRPAGGWASWARTMMGLDDWQGWHARYIPKRAALAKALREARADADVWLALTTEDPALTHVRIDLPREEPAELRAERLALIAEDPGLAELLTWKPAEWPTIAASEKEKATLAYRLEKLGIGPGRVGPATRVGPTWFRRAPTNRDLALLVILSGWISDAWKGEKTIGDAIEDVVSAVRTHGRASAKH